MNRNPFTKPLYDPSSPMGHGFSPDMAKLFLATLSPSDLSGKSLGMCAHLPFAEQVIDFDAIPSSSPSLYQRLQYEPRGNDHLGQGATSPRPICARRFPSR